jgi:hypothetical protein
MALEKSIQVLAATPPPKSKSFINAGKANVRIRELATQLGLPKEPTIYNIKAANSRIAELEAMISAKPSARPAAPAAVVTAPPATAPAGPTRDQLCAVAQVLGLGRVEPSVSIGALSDTVEKSAYQAGVRFPNMTADAELAKLHWRSSDPVSGLARVVRANLQEKINSIFEK